MNFELDTNILRWFQMDCAHGATQIRAIFKEKRLILTNTKVCLYLVAHLWISYIYEANLYQAHVINVIENEI